MTYPKVLPIPFNIWFRLVRKDNGMIVLILSSPPIGAFYMVGDIDSARAKGEKILAELEKST